MRRHERDVAKIAKEHGGRLLRRGNGHLAVELPRRACVHHRRLTHQPGPFPETAPA